MRRSSRYITLSEKRDKEEFQAYRNEMRTTGGILPRVLLTRELHGDDAAEKVFSLHCKKFDPMAGPLKYAVQHDLINLVKLIIESGDI